MNTGRLEDSYASIQIVPNIIDRLYEVVVGDSQMFLAALGFHAPVASREAFSPMPILQFVKHDCVS